MLDEVELVEHRLVVLDGVVVEDSAPVSGCALRVEQHHVAQRRAQRGAVLRGQVVVAQVEALESAEAGGALQDRPRPKPSW